MPLKTLDEFKSGKPPLILEIGPYEGLARTPNVTTEMVLEALVKKLEWANPHLTNIALIAAIHGCQYLGPNYAKELADARWWLDEYHKKQAVKPSRWRSLRRWLGVMSREWLS